MTKKKKAIILGVITVALALISWFILPDEVVMQVRIDGEPGSVLSKPVAVIAPLLISGMGLYLYLRDDVRNTKNVILIFAGYLVSVFSWVVNVFL